MNLTTTVDKTELLTILENNKTKHTELYTDSLHGYIDKIETTLIEKLDDIKQGKIDNISVYFVKPVDYSKEYDRAINMVKMNVNNTIELDSNDFSNLVLDEWQWTSTWFTSNAAYSVLASGCAVERGLL